MEELQGFLNFDPNTGVQVKTKANILQDLITISEQAYGNSFTVIQGTEMYTFLDTLASALTETGNAAKAVYDAFGFVTATGSPLDVLCSLAGISRKEGESDTALRARYFKFLYTKSVGTLNGLEAQLLQLTFTTKTGDIINCIDELKITNNDSSTPIDFIGISDLPGHSIAVVCKHNKNFPPNIKNTETGINEYGKLRQLISDTVKKYKSLGCGVFTSTERIEGTTQAKTFNYVVASKLGVSIELSITMAPDVSTDEARKNSIKYYITQNIIDYISTRRIAEDLLYSGFSSCVYKAYNQCGYDDYTFELSTLTINGQTISSGKNFEVKKDKFVELKYVLDNPDITVNFI